MAKPVLISTDVVQDVGRGRQEAVEAIDQAVDHFVPHVSVMTEITLFRECDSEDQLQALLEFLSRFEVLPLDQRVSRQALKLRKKHAGLSMSRALIAATAMRFGMSLLTGEQEEYVAVDSLDMEDYP